MTCRKAKSWLDTHGVEYEYRDILKQPLSSDELAGLASRAGKSLAEIVNTRSPSFKALRTKVKDDDHAVELIQGNPRLMIRPALDNGTTTHFGFNEAAFQNLTVK